MKTRSKRAQQEQAGVPPTPPQSLSTTRPRRQTRTTRSTASPDIYSDNSTATNSQNEASNKPSAPSRAAQRPTRVTKPRGRKRQPKGKVLPIQEEEPHPNGERPVKMDIEEEGLAANTQSEPQVPSPEFSPRSVHVPDPLESLPHSSPPPVFLTNPAVDIPVLPKDNAVSSHQPPLLPKSPDSPGFPAVSTDVHSQDDQGNTSSSLSSIESFSDSSLLFGGTPCPPGKISNLPPQGADEMQCDHPSEHQEVVDASTSTKHPQPPSALEDEVGESSSAQHQSSQSTPNPPPLPGTPMAEYNRDGPLTLYPELVYNWPQNSEDALKSHTVINMLVNEQIEELMTGDPSDQMLSLAVPTQMLPDILNFISRHPDARGTALENMNTGYPRVQELLSKLTSHHSAAKPIRNDLSRCDVPNRATDDDEDESLPIISLEPSPIHPPAKSSRLRRGAAQRAAEVANARQVLKENEHHTNVQQTHVSNSVRKHTKLVPQLYDEKGMLTLNAYKEVPLDDNEGSDGWEPPEDLEEGNIFRLRKSNTTITQTGTETTNVSPDNEIDQQSETPRSSGWGIANFLPSAQLVTKFLPTFVRPSPARTTSRLPTTPRVPSSTSNAIHNTRSIAESNTEPRSKTQDAKPISHTRASKTVRSTYRHRDIQPKHQLLTKGEREVFKEQKEEIKRLRAQLEKQKHSGAMNSDNGENAKGANQSKENETSVPGGVVSSEGVQLLQQAKISAKEIAEHQNEQITQQQQDEAVKKAGQELGAKRKRTPDIIPNPPGCSYGLHPDYFWQDEDEPIDSDLEETPTQEPPTKKTRLSDSDVNTFGDPTRATPYLGTIFASPDTPNNQPLHRNTFVAQEMSEMSPSETHIGQPSSSTETPFVQPNSFRVPSPGSSDDSDSEGDESSIDHPPATPTPTPQQSQQVSTIASSSPEKSNVPAKAPQPITTASTTQSPALEISSARAQSSGMALGASNALEKARQTALKHQPLQPSRLREASRLSTSTIASDLAADIHTPGEGEFSSSMHYQQLISDRVKQHISTAWNQPKGSEVVKAQGDFDLEFARWSQPSPPKSVRANVSPNEFEGVANTNVIDQKVLDRIKEVWTAGKNAGSGSNEFSNEFSPWMAAGGNEVPPTRRRGSLPGDSDDDEAWGVFEEELDGWMAEEGASSQAMQAMVS